MDEKLHCFKCHQVKLADYQTFKCQTIGIVNYSASCNLIGQIHIVVYKILSNIVYIMARARNFNRNAIQNKYRVNRCRIKKRFLKNAEEFFVQSHQSIDSCDESVYEIATNKSTRELLRSWVNYHGVTMRAVNDLMKILKKAG